MIEVKSLSKYLLIGGVLGILFGIINFFGTVNSGTNATNVSDALINILGGLLAFVAWFLLKKQNQLVIIVIIVYTISTITYGFWAGRGLNFVSLIVGLGVLYLLWQYKSNGEIS